MSQLRKTLDEKNHPKEAILFGGIVAGIGEVIFTYPLDTIKTQLQINPKKYKNIVDCGSHIIKTNGIMGLYYGIFPSLLQVAGKSGIRFTIYDTICNNLKNNDGSISNYNCFLSGLCAGAVEAIIWTSPTERLKILQQKQSDNGIRCSSSISLIKNTIKYNGIMGLYIGTVPTIIKQSASVGVRFYLYNLLKNKFIDPNKSPEKWKTIIIGGVSGCLSTVINHPVDVIKSYIQSKNNKNNIFKTTRLIINKYGYLSLMNGLKARFLRVGIAQGITFTIYESFLSYYESL